MMEREKPMDRRAALGAIAGWAAAVTGCRPEPKIPDREVRPPHIEAQLWVMEDTREGPMLIVTRVVPFYREYFFRQCQMADCEVSDDIEAYFPGLKLAIGNLHFVPEDTRTPLLKALDQWNEKDKKRKEREFPVEEIMDLANCHRRVVPMSRAQHEELDQVLAALVSLNKHTMCPGLLPPPKPRQPPLALRQELTL